MYNQHLRKSNLIPDIKYLKEKMKMKEIIPKDDYGVFVDGHDVALVDSR